MLARIKALHAGMILAGGLLVSSSALGLVLGNISLSSALNEPLAATIELDSLAGVEASQITVALGDQAAYDRVNVARDPFLDTIQFSVEVDSDNEGRILLSSTENVAEPFLNLIISVTEPGGVTLKEYTLLVELPTFSEAPPAEAQPAAAGQAAAAPADSGSAETYAIETGDTLWEIAAETRPAGSVSVQQMMVAIQRANPDAFINNNINRLINGRVLRIPTLQDINVIDQQAAVAQVNQQNTDLGGQPLAGGANAAAGAATDPRDQLSVLTSDDEAGLAGGSSDLAATIAALENQLMLSEENLDRARIENLELNNRLSSLQEQIDLLENIIAIEDERIAQLQAELTSQAAATEQALASGQTAADALSELNNEPASGLTGLLRNTVVVLGGVLGLVLLFLGFLVYRRKQALASAEERSFNPALAGAYAEQAAAADEEDDEDDDVEETPGFLAGLLARFRRSAPEDDDDYEADAAPVQEAARAPLVAQAVAQAVAQTAVPAKKTAADQLLDDMGINEEMLSLDDALDGIDSSHVSEAEAFAPVDEEEPVVVDTLAAPQAETSSVQTGEADYALAAADKAFAAIDSEGAAEPEIVEFTTSTAAAPANVPEAAQIDTADTFEFKLKEVPEAEAVVKAAAPKADIETFDFKLSKPVAEKPASVPAPAATETLEVVNFPGSTPVKKEAAPQTDDDLSLDLGDLSFDDTMVSDEDAESSEYKPRAGNECDTKLDLATAYEAMGDVSEAIEILDEVIAEGTPAQIETAQRLKQTWQSA